MLSGIWTTNNKHEINCCIWFVDSFECVKMHGHTNPKLTSNKFPQLTTIKSPLTININQFCVLTIRFLLRCLIFWSHPNESNCFLIGYNCRSGITNWSGAYITSSLSTFEYKYLMNNQIFLYRNCTFAVQQRLLVLVFLADRLGHKHFVLILQIKILSSRVTLIGWLFFSTHTNNYRSTVLNLCGTVFSYDSRCVHEYVVRDCHFLLKKLLTGQSTWRGKWTGRNKLARETGDKTC